VFFTLLFLPRRGTLVHSGCWDVSKLGSMVVLIHPLLINFVVGCR
jgi:hypothetical protein